MRIEVYLMDKNIFDRLVPKYLQKLSSDEITDLLIEISDIGRTKFISNYPKEIADQLPGYDLYE